MSRIRTLAFLNESGFTKYKVGVKLEDSPTLFIYMVKGTKKVCLHESFNPNYYLKKWRVWTRTGNETRLPRAVARELPCLLTEAELTRHVQLFYVQGKYDKDLIKHTLLNGDGLLHQKLVERNSTVNVAAVRVTGDPGWYRVIKYSGEKSIASALQELQTRSLERITSKGKFNNIPYLEWCKRNKEAIELRDFHITHISLDTKPMQAMFDLAKYALDTEDHYLNLYMPVF